MACGGVFVSLVAHCHNVLCFFFLKRPCSAYLSALRAKEGKTNYLKGTIVCGYYFFAIFAIGGENAK